MNSSSSAAAFRVIQAALLPIGVVGYVPFVFKMVAYSRQTGASATVLASFYTRWMQHKLGTRRDDACDRMMAVLPNIAPLGLQLETTPTFTAHRVTGYVPKIYRYPYEGEPPLNHQSAARTTFFDAALERHLAEVGQLVILGAGLDTRSYRLPKDSPVRCFEVDTPGTQAFKREVVRKAGVDSARVHWVPADFMKEDWFEKLLEAGFEPDKPTFFLWEAVTMYLDPEAVERTLRRIAGTASGSVVAFDYFSDEMLQRKTFFMRYAKAMTKAVGEPFGTFGMDTTPPARARAASFLEQFGLSLEEHRNFGHETGRSHPKAGFVTAIRSSDGRGLQPTAGPAGSL